MRRVVFSIFAAFVAGTGLATVLGLGVASFTAAAIKSQNMDQAIYERVWDLASPVKIAIAAGFIIGASLMIWLFYGKEQSQSSPDEEGSNDRSEV